MRERDIEEWAVRKAREQGWWVRKFASPNRRSAPDDIFAKHGRVFWIEFKATGEEPTALQEEEHAKMRAAGLTVYVCDSRHTFIGVMLSESRDEESFRFWDTLGYFVWSRMSPKERAAEAGEKWSEAERADPPGASPPWDNEEDDRLTAAEPPESFDDCDG